MWYKTPKIICFWVLYDTLLCNYCAINQLIYWSMWFKMGAINHYKVQR